MSTYNDFTSSVDNYLKESQLPATPTAGDVYHIIHEDASTPVFCYSGTTAPTTSTACQNIGDKYIVNNTDIYECTNIVTSGGTTTYTWVKAPEDKLFRATPRSTTWEEVDAAFEAGKIVYIHSVYYDYILTFGTQSSHPDYFFQGPPVRGLLMGWWCKYDGWSQSSYGLDAFNKQGTYGSSLSIQLDGYENRLVNHSSTISSLSFTIYTPPGTERVGNYVHVVVRTGNSAVTPTVNASAPTIHGEPIPTIPANKYCEMMFRVIREGSDSCVWTLSTLIYD